MRYDLAKAASDDLAKGLKSRLSARLLDVIIDKLDEINELERAIGLIKKELKQATGLEYDKVMDLIAERNGK